MSDADSDALLMKRIARGEPGAVQQMAARAVPRLHALASRILRDGAEAEDVTQEAIIRAVDKAPQWAAHGAKIETWLHKVALNLCRDRLRKRREVATPQVPDGTDPTLDPESALLDAERSQLVAAAVHALPERQREAIILVHYQELSGAQASEILGISIEALESLLSRGRRSLKEHFLRQEHGND